MQMRLFDQAVQWDRIKRPAAPDAAASTDGAGASTSTAVTVPVDAATAAGAAAPQVSGSGRSVAVYHVLCKTVERFACHTRRLRLRSAVFAHPAHVYVCRPCRPVALLHAAELWLVLLPVHSLYVP